MEVTMRAGFRTSGNFPTYKKGAIITINGDKEIVEMLKAVIELMNVGSRPIPGWDTLRDEWFIE